MRATRTFLLLGTLVAACDPAPVGPEAGDDASPPPREEVVPHVTKVLGNERIARDPAVGLLSVFAELGQVVDVAETPLGVSPDDFAKAKTSALEEDYQALQRDESGVVEIRDALTSSPAHDRADDILPGLDERVAAARKAIDDIDAPSDASFAVMKAEADARIEALERSVVEARKATTELLRSTR